VEFEKQAEQFLATLTSKFETDDDFAAAKEEAAAIVEEMKDEEVRKAFERGEIREIVALIAYLNSLK